MAGHWPPRKVMVTVMVMVSRLVDALVMDTCDGRPHQVTLNTQAQAYIGVVVGASAGGEGMYGCGGWRGEGVAAYEALRWSLARANLDGGGLGSRIVTDSFVPGIKFGLHVYDSCGHGERAVAGLGELFPVVREGPSACSPLSNDTLLALGVVDLTGFTSTHHSLAHLLQKYYVPVVNVAAPILVPAEERGRAVLEFLSNLKWEAITILVMEEDYSANVVKVATEMASAHNVCVSNIIKVPSQLHDSRAQDQHSSQTDLEYRNLVRAAMADGRVSGIAVVASGPVLSRILAAAKAESTLTRRVYWLLSDLPEDELDLVRELAQLAKGLFIVANSPPALQEFEDHWKTLQDIKLQPTPENEWVLGYLQQEKGCHLEGMPLDPIDTNETNNAVTEPLPVCHTFRMRDDDLNVLARTRAVLPAIHGLFTFFTAMKNAWRLKCRNRRGVCEELQEMSRKELLADYLTPLKFQHNGPGTRSLTSLKGGKRRNDWSGKLSETSIGLYSITVNPSTDVVNVQQTMLMDNSSLQLIDESLIPGTTNCPRGSCGACLNISDEETQNATEVAEIQKHVFMPSPDHVIVAALFPIHEPSPDGADCSKTVNRETMQEVEAFLWAVDQINEHQKLLPATTLGALILDTCGSRIRTMNQVTSLLKSSLSGIDVDINDIQTFITSLDPESARVTGEMLSSLNVTSINLGPSQAHSPYALQMSPPINMEAEAMVQMLRFLGWDYVSLVVSSEDGESVAGAEAFRTVARASRVCLANDIKMVPLEPEAMETLAIQIVDQLTEKAVAGARAAVLFLTVDDTKVLLSAIQKAVLSHRLLKHQLVFLGASTWGDHKEQLREFDSGLGGALVLKDGQQDVRDFIAYYRLLNPEKNSRNPWFTQYWEQEFGCIGGACKPNSSPFPVVPYVSVPSTPRVVQAIFSFGAALTQLIGHLCPQHDGTLCPGLPKWRQRMVLNEFLRNTEVSRVDKPSEFFQFTENFHGNAPLEVLSLTRYPDHTPIKYKYEKVGRYVDSGLTLGNAMAEFHNGSVTRMDHLPSTCIAGCSTCNHHETDYVFVDSPEKLYIVATFNVHDKGDRPLECGGLNGDKGIQSVESLLWALDRLNSNPEILPGVTLGAIILDACTSKEKVVRDVTNFLTGRIPERMSKKVPSSNNIVGLITGGFGEEVRQVIDVTQPYGITTIATQASNSVYSNTRRFPVLLRLAPPNDVMGGSIASLLLYWRWEVFSIVYSDGGTAGDINKHLLRETEAHKLKPIMAEPVPLKVDQVDYMLGVWSKLAEAAQQGARAVVLLLEPHHAALFFKAAATLRAKDLLHNGDFVFIMAESPLPFIQHESEALGMVILQPISGPVRDFQTYFKSLSLANHTSYPWFHEFWAETFKCQGAGCFTGVARNLSGYKFRQAEDVVNIINAVSLLGQGLDRWRKDACAGTSQTESPQGIF